MEFKFYFIIGLLLLIISIALVIEIYFFNNKDTEYREVGNDGKEGFQTLSRANIANMQTCSGNNIDCININYYDYSGTLINGNFLKKTLPSNMYLDTNNILQGVPYGNIVNPDYKGYSAKTDITKYTNIEKLGYDALTNPQKCDKSKTTLYYPINPVNPTIVCADVSYITMNDDKAVINYGEIIIPQDYYIDSSSGLVKAVPYGFSAAPDKRSIIINIDFSKQLSSTSYNSNNYDVEYHSDPTDINKFSDASTAGPGKMWILDNCGNLVSVPYSDIKGSTLYNEPGSFRFGSSNYVPNYEESVYLSKLTNISTLTPVTNSADIAAGFCSALYPDKNKLEEKCNALDKNACGSTSCCVLLGGQKCVYGNESGPYFKSNYSNFMVTNPEFYYYQGKCYGNCSA